MTSVIKLHEMENWVRAFTCLFILFRFLYGKNRKFTSKEKENERREWESDRKSSNKQSDRHRLRRRRRQQHNKRGEKEMCRCVFFKFCSSTNHFGGLLARLIPYLKDIKWQKCVCLCVLCLSLSHCMRRVYWIENRPKESEWVNESELKWGAFNLYPLKLLFRSLIAFGNW